MKNKLITAGLRFYIRFLGDKNDKFYVLYSQADKRPVLIKDSVYKALKRGNSMPVTISRGQKEIYQNMLDFTEQLKATLSALN